MNHPISDAWFLRIKSATQDLVKACNGVINAGEIALVSKSEVSRWQSATDSSIIPLTAMLALESYCGQPFLTTVLAELNGRRLSDELSVSESSAASVIRSHADVMAKGADLHGTVAIAMGDHVFTPTEAALADRKAADHIAALNRFRQDLARVRAGEIRPELPTAAEPSH
ncbi:hypothetical protein ACD578_05290 [Microvirga sp. RSM25]|uniref:hypothetical protein n=1 Tax=Microvirga sp. RSM25 TaxID=3273802 RepID=UPI00384E9C21